MMSLVLWGSYQIAYPSATRPNLVYDGVFLERILKHIDYISKEQRSVGDQYHPYVQRYLIDQLQQMKLTVSKHNSTIYNPNNKRAAPIRNIIAKYPGTDSDGKDLMLLAHYDSAKFSQTTGAADDAHGVAIILEVVRAFLRKNPQPKNDIIILFTDAEELGLLGAYGFIHEQIKNHDIGLIINLEARGSSGPSMIIPETLSGNQGMIDALDEAGSPFPVTSSLHYEIYKKLPNDTDLTPFKQLRDINGFNLAFIDRHYNYHTKLDHLGNLSLNSLAHQTIQVIAMLNYLADYDLTKIKSDESTVFFSLPWFGLVIYSMEFALIINALTVLSLLGLIWYGLKRKKLTIKEIITGIKPLIIMSFGIFIVTYIFLYLAYLIQPGWHDILQGYPYPGHHFQSALFITAIIISFAVYSRQRKHQNLIACMLVPTSLWIVGCNVLLLTLPGASFLIWPACFSLILIFTYYLSAKLAEQLAPVFLLANTALMSMLLVNLPIALGLKTAPVTGVIIGFLLAMFALTVADVKRHKQWLVTISLPAIYMLATALFYQEFSEQKPQPTSLSYLIDVDTSKAYFFNYDELHSGWNQHVLNNPVKTDEAESFRRQYRQPFKKLSHANPVEITPTSLRIEQPLVRSKHKKLIIDIEVSEATEVIEIFSKNPMTIHEISIDGRRALLQQPLSISSKQKIMEYYFNGKKQITVDLMVDKNDEINWQLQSHRLDLLENSNWQLQARPSDQMPKPFLKTDNIIVVQSFTPSNDQ